MAVRWWVALAVALILHGGMTWLVVRPWGPTTAEPVPRAGETVLTAELTPSEAEAQAQREAEAQAQREAEAQAQREAEAQARREAEAQARREAEAQAQREAEAQARREAEAQAQREAEAQARREAEAQARREAEAQARREAEAQAQREAEAQAQREAEAQARREAAARARAAEEARIASARERYIDAIKSQVSRQWRKPGSVAPGSSCRVVVSQLPDGEIIDVQMQSCSSDDGAFRRSVEAAVRRASPLPLPPDRRVFERDIQFTFVAEP